MLRLPNSNEHGDVRVCRVSADSHGADAGLDDGGDGIAGSQTAMAQWAGRRQLRSGRGDGDGAVAWEMVGSAGQRRAWCRVEGYGVGKERGRCRSVHTPGHVDLSRLCFSLSKTALQIY